ncbi:MAG: rRNA pseudouridine synthase [Clostridia bacterium]|nr:rRNA pseudouridine synthase [Clostridia bacterium]
MRLDKLISNLGIATRSEIKKIIRSGRVVVNGNIVKDASIHIGDDDSVLLDGIELQKKDFIYLLLDKPDEVVTAMEDKRLSCVGDLLPPELKAKKISPVGRLDYHTTGLLLITNDGEFSHRMTSPKYHLPKKYLVTYSGNSLSDKQIEEAQNGMKLHDMNEVVNLKPAKLELCDDYGDYHRCFLTLTEGKTHQVRRMISAWGCEVIELRRVQIGSLVLDNSDTQLRELDVEEISKLKKELQME